MHIRFSDDARHDLNNIKEYLQPRSPQGCERVLSSIFTIIDQLQSFPLLGHAGEVDGTFEILAARYGYVVVYTLPDQFNIEIERILSTSQEYPAKQ